MALLLFCCALLPVPDDNPLAWVGLLEKSDEQVHSFAVQVFGLDYFDSERAACISQLREGNEIQRALAAHALGKMGPEAAPAIPDLIRTLKSRRPLQLHFGSHSCGDVAPGAARKALVRIGPAAIPALTEALKHKDALTRVNAAWALWKLEKCNDRVVPVLVAAWKDRALFTRDECIRYDATAALGEIGREQPGKVLPILRNTLDGEDEEVAFAALRSLSIMGRQVKEAVALLVERLHDRRDTERSEAGSLLREAGPAAVPALVGALACPETTVRECAAWTLGGMKPAQVQSALPALRKATADPDKGVRERAIWALEMVGRR
jgi:HEAT repeat protein